MNICINDSKANKLSIKTNAIKIKRVRGNELDKLNSKHIVHKQQHSTESILELDNKNNNNMLKRSIRPADKLKELNSKINSNYLIKNEMKFDKNSIAQSPICWFALTKKICEKKLSYKCSKQHFVQPSLWQVLYQ